MCKCNTFSCQSPSALTQLHKPDLANYFILSSPLSILYSSAFLQNTQTDTDAKKINILFQHPLGEKWEQTTKKDHHLKQWPLQLLCSLLQRICIGVFAQKRARVKLIDTKITWWPAKLKQINDNIFFLTHV